ncbi:MAG: hypothetical protein V1897_02290 [Pseudomonadota bacterium]
MKKCPECGGEIVHYETVLQAWSVDESGEENVELLEEWSKGENDRFGCYDCSYRIGKWDDIPDAED